MRILFATNAYPPAIGGAEVAGKRIVDALSLKHEVTVLTRKDGWVRNRGLEKEIVELGSKTSYSYMSDLNSFLERTSFDVYIAFGFGKHFFDTLGHFAKKNGKKSIGIPVGYFHTNKGFVFKSFYRFFIAKDSLESYDCLVTATAHERDFWVEEFGIKADRIKVIAHSLPKDFARFKQSNVLKKNGLKRNQYIFYVGRKASNKRPDLLIQAFNDIKTKVKLVIAGKDTDDDSLKRLADRNTIFLGTISDDEKKELIKNSLFCVFPSEYETYGLFILEALAFNRPIIVSNIWAFHETILEPAFFFENNVDSIREKVSEFISKPKLIKRFTKVNQDKAYLDLIRSL